MNDKLLLDDCIKFFYNINQYFVITILTFMMHKNKDSNFILSCTKLNC